VSGDGGGHAGKSRGTDQVQKGAENDLVKKISEIWRITTQAYINSECKKVLEENNRREDSKKEWG